MRKSFSGLSVLVEQAFPGKLLTGSLFVFMNRRRHMTKILYWDGDGLAVWNKRLERGLFNLPMKNEGHPHLNRREFLALLEGVIPQEFTPRYDVESEIKRRRKILKKTSF